MFFEESLLKPLSFVIGVPPPSSKIGESLILNSKNAFEVKNDIVVFVIKPDIESVKSVIFQKKSWTTDKEFHVLFVPRRTIECDEELDKEKVSIY